jgi:hypothetical protein
VRVQFSCAFLEALRHLQELQATRIIPRQPSGDAPTHCGLLSEVFRRGRHIRPFEQPDKSTLGANVRISICSILNRCCLVTFNIEHPLTMRKVGCASKYAYDRSIIIAADWCQGGRRLTKQKQIYAQDSLFCAAADFAGRLFLQQRRWLSAPWRAEFDRVLVLLSRP